MYYILLLGRYILSHIYVALNRCLVLETLRDNCYINSIEIAAKRQKFELHCCYCLYYFQPFLASLCGRLVVNHKGKDVNSDRLSNQ